MAARRKTTARGSKRSGMKPAELTHLSETGSARMVDVGPKAVTSRRAVATAQVHLGPVAFKALTEGRVPKGDAMAVARIAGIAAAKKTSDLIPLCHPLAITSIEVELTPVRSRRVVRIRAEVACEGRTGVEMEALTAACVAALALYDMLKAVERGIEIGPIRLEAKSGGRSGAWKRKSR